MSKSKTHTISISKKAFFAFFFILLTRLLVIDLYYVPTGSMKPAIQPRSYILVSKISFGTKLPKHTHQIPFISFLLKLIHIKKTTLWKNKKLPAFESVKRNDIALVEAMDKKIVKRIVGLPGDEISIINGYLYVNDEVFDDLNIPLLKTFMISSTNRKKLEYLKMNNSLSEWRYVKRNSFEVKALSSFFTEIKKDSTITISMAHFSLIDTTKKRNITPKCKLEKWSQDNYGRFLIPYKGMKLQLNEQNYCVYEQIINEYENANIHIKNNYYYIDNMILNHYTFKNDYFFLMGDNRMNSIDSRFLGVFPRNKILGKVLW